MNKKSEKHTVLIDDDLFIDIKEYCDINNLKIGAYINNLLKDAFLDSKYGDAPFLPKKDVRSFDMDIPDIIRKHAEKHLITIEPKEDSVDLNTDVESTIDVQPIVETIEEPVVEEEKPMVTENKDKPKRRKLK